jgi:hypothetical protein
MKGNILTLSTKKDLEQAIKFGASASAFVTVCTMLMVAIGTFESYACVDAMVFGIGAWFMVTKQSRVAAGIVAAMYIVELGAGILGDPKGAEVSGVTLLMLAAMIRHSELLSSGTSLFEFLR